MSVQQRRSSSKRARSKNSSLSKSNNILVFKLIDPIFQSILFVVFIYSLDSNSDTQYQTILQYLVVWQVLSCIVNFILHPAEQLKQLRIVYLTSILAYAGIFYLIGQQVTEKYITINIGSNITIPLYDSIYEMGALVISFLYYIICFREIRAMLTSMNNGS